EAEKITSMTNFKDSALLVGSDSGRVLSLYFEGDRIKKSTVLFSGNRMKNIFSILPLSGEKILISGEKTVEHNLSSGNNRSVLKKNHFANSFKQIIRYRNNLLGLHFGDISVASARFYDTV